VVRDNNVLQRPGEQSAWNSEFCIGAGLHMFEPNEATTLSQEPAPLAVVNA
jgi:hypothetical protein